MALRQVLAEQTISISEFRKNPGDVFKQRQPVAVLSNNKPAGYVLNADLYERMVMIIEQAAPEMAAEFHPTRTRLNAIERRCSKWLDDAADEELEEFYDSDSGVSIGSTTADP